MLGLEAHRADAIMGILVMAKNVLCTLSQARVQRTMVIATPKPTVQLAQVVMEPFANALPSGPGMDPVAHPSISV